jgi:hypothetical protein
VNATKEDKKNPNCVSEAPHQALLGDRKSVYPDIVATLEMLMLFASSPFSFMIFQWYYFRLATQSEMFIFSSSSRFSILGCKDLINTFFECVWQGFGFHVPSAKQFIPCCCQPGNLCFVQRRLIFLKGGVKQKM